MKRIASVVTAALVSVGAVTAVQAAVPTMTPDAQVYVTVSSDDGVHASAVENLTMETETASLNSVITAPANLAISGSTGSQKFDVSVVSNKETAADLFLRLSTETNSKTAEFDATKLLTTYDIEVKNSAGETVYNSKVVSPKVNKTSTTEYSTDIYLGRFNDSEGKTKDSYTLTVAIPKGLTASEIKDLKKINWNIVSDPAEPGATAVPTPEIVVTASPAAIVSASDSSNSSNSSSSTQSSSRSTTSPSSGSSSSTVSPSTTESPLSTTKTVGRGKGQIPAGKYTITATNRDAVVKIYGSDNKVKSEYELTEKVPRAIVDLVEGDKIENVGAIDMQEYRGATATPRPTATPRATVKPTTKPSTATAAKTTTAPAASKTNPKTGDTAPVAGVCALAVFALGMAAYPVIEKKRKDK